MSNNYWNGATHAYLRKEDISAKWIRSQYGGRGLGATNKAFCIWYHGRQTIKHVDSEVLKDSLEKCGFTGFGFGVRDLDDAFKHMTKNNGKWTDNTYSSFGSYSGKSGDCKGGNGVYISSSDLPVSISNFLGAVDKSLGKLKNAMVVYKNQCQVIKQINIKPASPKSDWDKVKKNVDLIKKAAENVSKYAWLAPPIITASLPPSYNSYSTMTKATEFANALENRTTQTVKFLDVVGKMHDAMTLYVQATKAFDGDQRMGVAFGAMSIALTFVPVLGGFYGEIIKKIPGLVTDWKKFMDGYVSRIDNYQAYQEMKAKQDAKRWICPKCGSM